MRAAVGRVDVAAEVIGLGVAGADERADRAGAGGGRRRRRSRGARKPRRERRCGCPARPRPARAATTDASCARGVDRALGQHGAVGAERDGERRAGHAAGRPGLGVGDLVEVRPRRRTPASAAAARRDAAAEPAAGAVKSASRTPCAANSVQGLARRAAGPRRRCRARRAGAARRPRPGRRRRRRRRAAATSGIPGPGPSTGSSAQARPAARCRPAAARESRPRAPKHPHGAPACPRASATIWASDEPGEQRARGVGGGRPPGGDPGGERGLRRRSAPPRPARRAGRGCRTRPAPRWRRSGRPP